MGVRKTTCAVVVAASALTMLDVQGALGQLPDAPPLPRVPSLQPPVKVPQAPAPLPQVRVPVPTAPVEAPAVQVPRVQAPAPAVTGSSPSKPSPRTAGATAVSESGAPATRRQESGSSPRAERPAGRPLAHRAPRTRAERNLRAAVTRLWACSYVVSSVQRQVLQRRAGLDGHPPTSVKATARALDLSPRTVRRVQRAGLRKLRRANRSDGCAMAAGPEGIAGETRSLVAVATAPALRPVADVGGTSDDDRLAASRREDTGAVLGQRDSSTSGAKDDNGGGRRPAKAQVGAPGDEGFSPFALLALLLALAGGALLMILRRDRDAYVAAEHPWMHPVVPPAPVREEPHPETRPEPAEPPARNLPNPPWRSVDERPAPAEPRPLTQDTPSVAHNARRAAGVAASGLASVAIGLLVRARRRR